MAVDVVVVDAAEEQVEITLILVAGLEDIAAMLEGEDGEVEVHRIEEEAVVVVLTTPILMQLGEIPQAAMLAYTTITSVN